MKLHAGLLLAIFLVAGVSTNGATIVIDNFTCADSVSLTGTGFNANFVSCPGSLGGEREDFLDIPSGPSGSVSTITSNPPTDAITGTFGSGIDEFEGMVWGAIGTNDLNLDLVGSSILVQIQSDSGGTLNAALCTSVTNDECDGDVFSATFSGGGSYQDVLIPLTGTPTILGSGANLEDVNAIDIYLSLNTPGAAWNVDAVDATVAPEPSIILLMSLCFLITVVTRSFWRKSAR